MQHHVQLAHASFYRRLMHEGVTVKFLIYDLLPIQLADLFRDSNAKELHEQWLAMIAATDGAICISKATADAFEAWIAEHRVPRAPNFRTSWVHIGADIDGSQPSRGLPEDAEAVLNTLRQRPTLLCVSTLEPRKRQQQILDAVERLWRQGIDVNLVFVGQQGWKIEALVDCLRAHPEAGRRLFWLQGISDEYLQKVYAASTCLIAASLNEGFGLSLIEAARHGIPIIARDVPVFREVAGEHAAYFRGETAKDLAAALTAWLEKYRIGQHRPSIGMPWSSWQQSAEKLKIALIEHNYPRHQLLVDTSELVQRDARTGIQRVVRSVLKEWLLNPPDGYRVEPVYATVEQGYRYAQGFKSRFLRESEDDHPDELIEYAPGDVFFGLDLNHHVPRVHRAFLHGMYAHGVDVRFMVYDLLPIQFPEFWEPQHSVHLVVAEWLSAVTSLGGAICISKAVADELVAWVEQNGENRQRPLAIDWFHLGADVDHSHPTHGLPPDANATLGQCRARPTFLTVGTLEPRKAHAQVLDAFDQIWQSGIDVNLVIVGKQGWMVEALVERLLDHPERNRRLFWLEGISDEYLEKVYSASTCLIAASYGEGFGLPLIEAAQHNLPIIARDIPVFREVAREHAHYFHASTASELAQSISEWLKLYQQGTHPKSNALPWLTWKQSAAELSQKLFTKASANA
jgi:glycosyltransferase involved in cell wall biosynthesis